MKPTPAQLSVLEQCHREHSLIVGGIDGSGVGYGIIKRCAAKGWLKWQTPSGVTEHSEWVLTAEGVKLAR